MLLYRLNYINYYDKRVKVYKNKTVKEKLYSLAAIIGTTYIIFHLTLLVFSNDVKTKWDIYDQNIKTKLLIISKIKSQIGYGGTIHAYKNYLLTNDEQYRSAFDESFKRFEQLKTAYLKLQSTKEEYHHLKIIENTLLYYKEEIHSPSKKAPHVIKDDLKALASLDALETLFEYQSSETSNKIDSTIFYIYSLSIFVVLSIILFTIYLKGFFQNTIINPLREIEKGLLSFFKFLSDKKFGIQPIQLDCNDEFGMMAKSINKNIEFTSNLHDHITNKNNEFEKLIESYGRNVIASKTDAQGYITYASEAFVEMSGYTLEELIGQPHSIVRHPDMPSSAFEEMWGTIQAGEMWKGEVKNRKKNGDFYFVEASVAPIFNDNHKIVGYSAIRQDITQQKEIIQLNKQLDTYKKHLETRVKNTTSQIKELMHEIEDTQKEVVFTMGAIGERRSEETGYHVKRVAEYSYLFAKYLGMSQQEMELLKQASPMHDIGKVGIADSILNKPGLFTESEHKIMQEHTTLGYNMLKSSKRPLLQTASIVAYQHHERWDGKGYPQGLKGEEIHIYGRITAIADVFDALGSHRVYKKAWEDDKIFNLFKEERGKQFDPKLVDIFFEHLDEFLNIRDKFQDIQLAS